MKMKQKWKKKQNKTNTYINIEKKENTINQLNRENMSRGANDSTSPLCQSFQNSAGIITDNEYEINSELEEEERSREHRKRRI